MPQAGVLEVKNAHTEGYSAIQPFLWKRDKVFVKESAHVFGNRDRNIHGFQQECPECGTMTPLWVRTNKHSDCRHMKIFEGQYGAVIEVRATDSSTAVSFPVVDLLARAVPGIQPSGEPLAEDKVHLLNRLRASWPVADAVDLFMADPEDSAAASVAGLYEAVLGHLQLNQRQHEAIIAILNEKDALLNEKDEEIAALKAEIAKNEPKRKKAHMEDATGLSGLRSDPYAQEDVTSGSSEIPIPDFHGPASVHGAAFACFTRAARTARRAVAASDIRVMHPRYRQIILGSMSARTGRARQKHIGAFRHQELLQMGWKGDTYLSRSQGWSSQLYTARQSQIT